MILACLFCLDNYPPKLHNRLEIDQHDNEFSKVREILSWGWGSTARDRWRIDTRPRTGQSRIILSGCEAAGLWGCWAVAPWRYLRYWHLWQGGADQTITPIVKVSWCNTPFFLYPFLVEAKHATHMCVSLVFKCFFPLLPCMVKLKM